MPNMANIWNVGRFEAKLLFRSWKFWILTLLCLGLSGLLNLYYTFLSYMFSGFSGSIGSISPTFALYMQYFFLSTLWAIVLVWFAYDYRHKDTVARVQGVLYSRPLSNAELVLGKFLGVLIPVFMLSLVLSVIAMVIRLIPGWFKGPVDYQVHAVQLGLQIVPGILFIVALAFAFIALLRSRALGIVAVYVFLIVVVGFISIGMVGPRPEYLPLFDVYGFSETFLRSQLIGYEALNRVLVQRAYVLAWTAIFLTTAVLLLPRRKGSHSRSVLPAAIIGVCALVIAGYVFHIYARTARAGKLKEEARQEQKALAGLPPVSVSHYDIKVDLTRSKRLSAKASIRLRNDNPQPLSQASFVLNAGMKVDSVTGAGQSPVPFTRGKTTLVADLSPALEPGDEREILVSYHGGIDVDAIYLDSNFEPSDLRGRVRGQVLFMLGYLPAYIGRYTFLPGESQWYPAANVRFGYAYPDQPPVGFFSSRVEAVARPSNTVISAGKLTSAAQEGSGAAVWESDDLIPAIPLLCGPYERIGTDIEGLELSLYYDKSHEKKLRFFDDAKDALLERIREKLKEYKERTGLEYPYPQFAAVEVPYQCRAYGGGWEMPNTLSQPGVVLIRESSFFTASFNRSYDQLKKRSKRRKEEIKTGPLKMQMLERYFNLDLTGGHIEHNLLRNYWDFRLFATGPFYPLMDYSLGNYIAEKATDETPYHSVYMLQNMNQLFGRGISQISSAGGGGDIREVFIRYSMDQDEVLKAMESKPIDAMAPEDDPEMFFNVMTVKGRAFMATLSEILGDKFAPVIDNIVEKYEHDALTLDAFRQEVQAVHGEGLDDLFNQWLHSTALPGFELKSKQVYRIKSEDPDPAYQVLLNVRNSQDALGYVKLTVVTEGDQVKRVYAFKGNEEKKIGIVVPEKPTSLSLVPFLARNVDPIRSGLKVAETEKPERIEEVVTVPLSLEDEGIIIDDVDTGFDVVIPEKKGFFKFFRKGRKDEDRKFEPYFGFRTPSSWYEWNTGQAYGRFKHTLKIKTAGEGKEKAIWKASVPERGRYEVFTYIGVDERSFRRRRKDGLKLGTNYKYLIKSADGEETVTFDASNAEMGWNHLGEFFFEPEAQAEVVLTDSGDGMIIADAIKLKPTSKP